MALYIMYSPHIPSFTQDDGIFRGLCPAFVQWYMPFGHAEVPERNDNYSKHIININAQQAWQGKIWSVL